MERVIELLERIEARVMVTQDTVLDSDTTTDLINWINDAMAIIKNPFKGREKLNYPRYMKAAINGAAEKILQVIGPESIPDVKPKINKTEGIMKNKAIDLHNILFEQLERLNDLDDDDMKSEKLVNEIKRADSMNKVASQIISNSRLVLDGIKVVLDAPDKIDLPEMLSVRALPAPKQDGKK